MLSSSIRRVLDRQVKVTPRRKSSFCFIVASRSRISCGASTAVFVVVAVKVCVITRLNYTVSRAGSMREGDLSSPLSLSNVGMLEIGRRATSAIQHSNI